MNKQLTHNIVLLMFIFLGAMIFSPFLQVVSCGESKTLQKDIIILLKASYWLLLEPPSHTNSKRLEVRFLG